MTEPADFGSGGVLPSGKNNIVQLGRGKVDIYDKSMLCVPICKCKDAPGKSVDGRSLKQSCVSTSLKAADKSMDHKSPYKAEVNYDMSKQPPAPIMDSEVATKGHDWLPGWIKKWWDADPDHPPFEAGEGMIRRPDVVIVKNPDKAPTQDNIKQVVEIKFPPDVMSKDQMVDYINIAGDDGKLAILKPSDCGCDVRSDPSPIPAPSTTAVTAGAVITVVFLGLLAL